MSKKRSSVVVTQQPLQSIPGYTIGPSVNNATLKAAIQGSGPQRIRDKARPIGRAVEAALLLSSGPPTAHRFGSSISDVRENAAGTRPPNLARNFNYVNGLVTTGPDLAGPSHINSKRPLTMGLNDVATTRAGLESMNVITGANRALAEEQYATAEYVLGRKLSPEEVENKQIGAFTGPRTSNVGGPLETVETKEVVRDEKGNPKRESIGNDPVTNKPLTDRSGNLLLTEPIYETKVRPAVADQGRQGGVPSGVRQEVKVGAFGIPTVVTKPDELSRLNEILAKTAQSDAQSAQIRNYRQEIKEVSPVESVNQGTVLNSTGLVIPKTVKEFGQTVANIGNSVVMTLGDTVPLINTVMFLKGLDIVKNTPTLIASLTQHPSTPWAVGGVLTSIAVGLLYVMLPSKHFQSVMREFEDAPYEIIRVTKEMLNRAVVPYGQPSLADVWSSTEKQVYKQTGGWFITFAGAESVGDPAFPHTGETYSDDQTALQVADSGSNPMPNQESLLPGPRSVDRTTEALIRRVNEGKLPRNVDDYGKRLIVRELARQNRGATLPTSYNSGPIYDDGTPDDVDYGEGEGEKQLRINKYGPTYQDVVDALDERATLHTILLNRQGASPEDRAAIQESLKRDRDLLDLPQKSPLNELLIRKGIYEQTREWIDSRISPNTYDYSARPITGRGIRHPESHERLSTDLGDMNHYRMGKWAIHKAKLKGEGIVSVSYHHNKRKIAGWPNTQVKPELAQAIHDTISHGGRVHTKHLSPTSQQFLERMIHSSGANQHLNENVHKHMMKDYTTASTTSGGSMGVGLLGKNPLDLKQQYDMTLGEIHAGNDNPQVRSHLNRLMQEMGRNNRGLSRDQSKRFKKHL